MSGVPPQLEPLLWDHDPSTLSWEEDRDFLIGRVLREGPWNTVCWLRDRVGDDALRDWIESHEGRGLSPKKLRFWELILEMPSDVVDPWVERAQNSPWGRRHG